MLHSFPITIPSERNGTLRRCEEHRMLQVLAHLHVFNSFLSFYLSLYLSLLFLSSVTTCVSSNRIRCQSMPVVFSLCPSHYLVAQFVGSTGL